MERMDEESVPGITHLAEPRVTVYCASSSQAPAAYGEAAYRLGGLLSRAGYTVVYGGGGSGSMGRLADGALDAGGHVVGIMPHFMRELEWAHPRVTEFVWTKDMAERKQRMLSVASAVVALPGGSGTFEELLEAITLKRLGSYLGPIVLLNQDRFYEPLQSMFARCVDERFMDVRHLDMWRMVDEVEAVVPAIEASPRWSAESRAFANLGRPRG